jgi:hypothetical protein
MLKVLLNGSAKTEKIAGTMVTKKNGFIDFHSSTHELIILILHF